MANSLLFHSSDTSATNYAEEGMSSKMNRGTTDQHKETSEQSVPSSNRLRKSERKARKFEHKVARMQLFRKKRKTERKERMRLAAAAALNSGSAPALPESGSSTNDNHEPRVSKLVKSGLTRDKLRSALINGQRVCIDLGLEDLMSQKECSRLAQQLGRLYGSNRKAEQPFHIYLSSVHRNGRVFQECVRKNCGFEYYLIDFVEKSVFEYFELSDIVYLSPDATEILEILESDKIYVIGGLVDETRHKNITKNQAVNFGVRSVRLPIEKFCEKSSQSGTFCQVLSINQVFEILLHVGATGDWSEAFAKHLPKRLGFCLKTTIKEQKVDSHPGLSLSME